MEEGEKESATKIAALLTNLT